MKQSKSVDNTFREDQKWLDARQRYIDDESVYDITERIVAACEMFEIERDHSRVRTKT